jgi:hypothetical protein
MQRCFIDTSGRGFAFADGVFEHLKRGAAGHPVFRVVLI